MTEGQTDKWVGYTPLNHKHPYKQNANTYAYTHTQAHTLKHTHTHAQTLFPPEQEETAPY